MTTDQSIRARVVLASIPFFAEVLDGEQIDILGEEGDRGEHHAGADRLVGHHPQPA